LIELLRSLDAANVRNLVFVATDVHFAAQIRYAPDLDGDGDPDLVIAGNNSNNVVWYENPLR